jgi:hypothetical protein
MTTRDTHELEEAGQKVSLETLKESLRANGGNPDSKKPVVLVRIGDKVIEIGIEVFLDSVEDEWINQACKAAKISDGRGAKTRLYDNIVNDLGLDKFLTVCPVALLKEFCRILLLEEGTRDSMAQQITDEIMLTGTKRFFHTLPPPLLKKWCEYLDLKTNGTKKVLVERLMVHIAALPFPSLPICSALRFTSLPLLREECLRLSVPASLSLSLRFRSFSLSSVTLLSSFSPQSLSLPLSVCHDESLSLSLLR